MKRKGPWSRRVEPASHPPSRRSPASMTGASAQGGAAGEGGGRKEEGGFGQSEPGRPPPPRATRSRGRPRPPAGGSGATAVSGSGRPRPQQGRAGGAGRRSFQKPRGGFHQPLQRKGSGGTRLSREASPFSRRNLQALVQALVRERPRSWTLARQESELRGPSEPSPQPQRPHRSCAPDSWEGWGCVTPSACQEQRCHPRCRTPPPAAITSAGPWLQCHDLQPQPEGQSFQVRERCWASPCRIASSAGLTQQPARRMHADSVGQAQLSLPATSLQEQAPHPTFPPDACRCSKWRYEPGGVPVPAPTPTCLLTAVLFRCYHSSTSSPFNPSITVNRKKMLLDFHRGPVTLRSFIKPNELKVRELLR
ncbi:uncharacterized protein [Vicugna pacos]|uniref:Uncharacterized protein n=1 Tax=Vicugna pacos TaxID=30538 RepID=A0ABM5DGA5_VICPA